MVLDRPVKCCLTLLGRLVGIAIGILLTGMGMAGTAVELGAADKTLPINRISSHIIKQVQKFQLPNR
jgi:hypothetical protein